MIETCHLKNVVIFIQTILSFVLSRKIIGKCIFDKNDPLVTQTLLFGDKKLSITDNKSILEATI